MNRKLLEIDPCACYSFYSLGLVFVDVKLRVNSVLLGYMVRFNLDFVRLRGWETVRHRICNDCHVVGIPRVSKVEG